MAIISRLPQGAGGGNITKMITINGGVGETISVVGEGLEDSVVLNSTGTSQYILIAKKDSIVTFTGALSGYTKRIAMIDAEDAIVNVMPEGALYWYGTSLVEFNTPTVYANTVGLDESTSYKHKNFRLDKRHTNYATLSKTFNNNDICVDAAVTATTNGNYGYRTIGSIYCTADLTNISKVIIEADVIHTHTLSGTSEIAYEECVLLVSNTNIIGSNIDVSTNTNVVAKEFYNISNDGKHLIEVDVSACNGYKYLYVVNSIGGKQKPQLKLAIHKIWLE